MRRVMGRVSLAVAMAASVSAETQKMKVRTEAASFNYWRDDQVAGGKQVSLSVSISPTWPPSELEQILYSGRECTIDYCFEFSGWKSCYCQPFSETQFQGSGRLPEGAFDVSPQGVARLELDVAQLTGGSSFGTCDRLDLTWTPDGTWSWSEDRRIRNETPTEVYQGVGHDDEWRATVSGSMCGTELPTEDPIGNAPVQTSHWTNITRTVKP